MAEGIHELTPTGRQRKPSEELMCQWISEAWREIPRESFLKCGITNSLDGTEDDLVFDSPSDESFDDDLIDELFASDSESDFEGF